MEIDELFDDDSFDPEKLFDENQYSTLIIDREGFSKKQNSTADLIESLLEPHLTRAESEEIFAELKKANAQQMMVKAIGTTRGDAQKKALTAACWECGLDFSPHFVFFAELVCNSGFEVAMEAFTVIQEMENKPSREEIGAVEEIISKQPEPANAMVPELESYIKSLH